MAEPLRLFILAGEPSGDRIGARLVEDLRDHTELTLHGVGGTALAEAGLQSLFDMDELAVMGFSDVLRRLPALLKRVRDVADAIERAKPDIVVLIDAQEFSYRVAKLVRRRDRSLPIVLYVAPSVWGWRPGRARKIAPVFTEVLAVLPHEPRVMKALGGPPTRYVGHPALDDFAAGDDAKRRSGRMLLLPGSRAGEVRRSLSTILGAAKLMLAGHPKMSFTLATLPTLEIGIRQAVNASGLDVAIVTDRDATRAAMQQAELALAVFGTVTLELALSGTPMVGLYVADGIQPWLYDRIRPKFLALPNIITDAALVPELPLRRPEPGRLAETALALLHDPSALAAQKTGFAAMRAEMRDGTADSPRVPAAERVLALAGRG